MNQKSHLDNIIFNLIQDNKITIDSQAGIMNTVTSRFTIFGGECIQMELQLKK